ncbi:MAG: permease, partial [Brevinema sp.]
MLKFRRGDIDATFGVLFDGIVKVIASIGIMSNLIGFDKGLIFTKIIPGVCLTVALGQLFVWKLSSDLKKRENRDDIVALPTAVTAGRLFVFLFSIMLPIYVQTKDPILALAAGIGANIISSILSILIAFISPFLLKIIPNVAIFGGLVGGSLAWLTFASLKDMFVYPEIAFVCLFIILIINFGRIKTKIPPVLISIFAGIIVGVLTKVITPESIFATFENIGFNTVKFGFSSIPQGIMLSLKYISIIFAWSLLESIVSIQGVQQAISVGDNFNITKTLVGVNLISLISALFFNPFPIGITWGYPTWKEGKATSNYALIIAFIYLFLGITGLIAVVTAIIPVSAVLPILIFIGLMSFQGTLANTESKYFGVIALAMVFPII